MSTRQRGTKRSLVGIGGSLVDLNHSGNLSVGETPSGGGVDDGDNRGFVSNGMDSAGGGVVIMSKPSGGDGASAKKNDRRHRCHLCGKLFNRPSSLKIHLTTHTGERPFPCPFPGCGRAFNVSSNMRRHFRTHTSNGEGVAAPPASAPEYTYQQQQQYQQPQQQQQQQQQQAAQTWNVNMYNPGTGGVQSQMQAPRSRAKRSKVASANVGLYQNDNDGEGSEDADAEGEREDAEMHQNVHAYPPFVAPGLYGGFPSSSVMNIPGLTGLPDMPGIPDLHGMQGMPMGMQMMPIEMAFPVDPALTAQGADASADADAEGDVDADADADAEEDADGENDGEGDGEGEGEGEDSNRPQLTHSTSNTRASTISTPASKTRTSARVQAKSKAAGSPSGGAKGKEKQAKATAKSTAFPSSSSTPSGAHQQQAQFRQILVPVSVPMSGDPAQATRIAQQYQHQYAQYAKYAQYAQYYMQHQQAQAEQSSTHQGPQAQASLPPHAEPSTPTDAIQRPGPATSAERTTPSGTMQGSPGRVATGEAVGRSVFVHWGPKTGSGAKEPKGKAEVQQDVPRMTAPAVNSVSASLTTGGTERMNGGGSISAAAERLAVGMKDSGREGGEDVHSVTDSNTTISANIDSPGAAVATTGNADPSLTHSVAVPSKKAITKASEAPSASVREDDTGEEAVGEEVADAEASSRPSLTASPRKRRKVARGRGRGGGRR